MSLLVETGTWTGNNTTPQTITLANGSLTPVAIIAWVTSSTALGSFGAHASFSMGFGTRRGGSTQSGCVGFFSRDANTSSNTSRQRGTTLLNWAGVATAFTASLNSFGAGQFVVSYSSAASANTIIFNYLVFGGTDVTDANVINQTMSSVGATQAITGVSFQSDVLFALDSDLVTTGGGLGFSFGFASSSSQFQCLSITGTDTDTMTSSMNNNRAYRSDSCLERLLTNADTSDARWDLDSFDSDGCTLGVVDAPTSTDRVATFLFLKGGTWEAGSKAKATATGNDTFTLANSSLTPRGVMLFTTNQTAVGIGIGVTDFCIGAGTTANATRGSARNTVGGVTGGEAINTVQKNFRASDSVIEEITGTTETSEAWYDTASAGSFIIDWAVNGGSAALIAYLAFGDTPAAPTVALGAYYNATRMIIDGIG